MVRAAQALPVDGIERIAAVRALLDVIGEHSMIGSGLAATPAVLDPLAAVACIAQHLRAPSPVLLRQQLGIGLLGWRLDREAA